MSFFNDVVKCTKDSETVKQKCPSSQAQASNAFYRCQCLIGV